MKLIFHNKLVLKIIRFGNQIKLKIKYQKIDNIKRVSQRNSYNID